MSRFHAHIRTPAAIEGSVAAPFAQQLLEDPSDGTIVDQDTGGQDGILRIEFDADDEADAQMHAGLLADRAPGCEVEAVERVDG